MSDITLNRKQSLYSIADLWVGEGKKIQASESLCDRQRRGQTVLVTIFNNIENGNNNTTAMTIITIRTMTTTLMTITTMTTTTTI